MLESTLKEIPLADIDQTSFEILKCYLYGCMPDLTLTTVISTLLLANKYIMEDLERRCEYFIWKHFEDYDVFEILNLALQIKSKSLEEYCCWYLKVNYDTYSHKSSFMEIPKSLRKQIIAEQWPGEHCRIEVAARDHLAKSTKAAGGKNCVIQ